MANYLYYLPGKPRATLEDCKALGLGYAFDANPATRHITNFKDAGSGCIAAAAGSDGPSPGYYPDKQTWRKHPDAASVWVGVWNDSRPTPQDVARSPMLPGLWIDYEETRWHVPIARRFGEDLTPTACLPRAFDLNDNGELILGEVKPRYRRLWELACLYDQAYITGLSEAQGNADTFTFSFPESDEATVAALQANYRVSLVELVLLGIYDRQFSSAVLSVLVDAAMLGEFVKKKLESLESPENATGSGSYGPGVSTAEAAAILPPA